MRTNAIIAKYGEKVEIVSGFKEEEIGPKYDPITGEILQSPDAELISYEATAYLKAYNERDVDGTNILSTDFIMILGEQDISPEKGYRVKFVGSGRPALFDELKLSGDLDSARIERVREVRLRGEPALYLCQLRAG